MNFPTLPTERLQIEASPDQVQFFVDNGFVFFPRITTELEVEWLREVYARLLADPPSGFLDGVFDLSRPYGTTGAPQLGQMLMPERVVTCLHQTLMHRNGAALASQLLGVEVARLESWSHLIFKAPRSQAETPWHQDESYWDIHKQYQTVACWVALDDVNTDNGCLWYVPGSHRGEVYRHQHLGGDPMVHVLEVAEPVDTDGAVPVPLPAGGIVMHHPRCLHYSGVNRTERMRRAWGVSFQTPPQPRAEPADYPWWHEGRRAHQAALQARGQKPEAD